MEICFQIFRFLKIQIQGSEGAYAPGGDVLPVFYGGDALFPPPEAGSDGGGKIYIENMKLKTPSLTTHQSTRILQGVQFRWRFMNRFIHCLLN